MTDLGMEKVPIGRKVAPVFGELVSMENLYVIFGGGTEYELILLI
jgi:hypothetical protein